MIHEARGRTSPESEELRHILTKPHIMVSTVFYSAANRVCHSSAKPSSESQGSCIRSRSYPDLRGWEKLIFAQKAGNLIDGR